MYATQSSRAMKKVYQWPTGTDLLDVPTIYEAYIEPKCCGTILTRPQDMVLHGTVPPF